MWVCKERNLHIKNTRHTAPTDTGNGIRSCQINDFITLRLLLESSCRYPEMFYTEATANPIYDCMHGYTIKRGLYDVINYIPVCPWNSSYISVLAYTGL